MVCHCASARSPACRLCTSQPGGRCHARVPTKRSSAVAGVVHAVPSKLAKACVPGAARTGLLPAGDFSAELRDRAVKYRAPWSHCQGTAASSARRVLMRPEGRGFCRTHARCALPAAGPVRTTGPPGLRRDDGDGECFCWVRLMAGDRCGHWVTQMRAYVSMPSAGARAMSCSRTAGANCWCATESSR